MGDPRKILLMRVYLMFALICIFGVLIIAQAVKLQVYEGAYWRSKADSLTTLVDNIEAVRGNIYADDGSLIATSIPMYEIRMDLQAGGLSKDTFYKYVDSLAWQLSGLFKEKTPQQYRRELIDAKKNKSRYHLIRRNVSYNEMKTLRTFSLFKKGRHKGGLIIIPGSRRERPFRFLAARTIGYARQDIKPVGLEGAYDSLLKGISGKRLVQKIAGGVKIPINDENEIEPRDGNDIISTIDINIQDVAENALLKQLVLHNADRGCVVLMEVETGEIRAIANLSRGETGAYYEYFNYAIGESTEPGSTFKLASVMAGFEDGYFNPDDSIDTKKGSIRFYDRVMKDSHEGGYGKISVQRAFEVSSNVAVSSLIYKYYSHNQQAFVDRMYKMGLGRSLGLEIAGEAVPKIRNTNERGWSGTALPWMSIGYEVQLTPLQILTFYNAVANNGKMVRPMFVKEVSHRGKTIKKFHTTVINEAICSPSTIKKAKQLLEGVVENGTAKNLKNTGYKIAGKTGTALMATDTSGYKKGKVKYQASFVGYFPADNPKYSCIVMVYSPSNDVYYGNVVAGPIFREIADKVYSTRIDITPAEAPLLAAAKDQVPPSRSGYQEDLRRIYARMGYSCMWDNQDAQWVNVSVKNKVIDLTERKSKNGAVPDVTGMGLRDAIYLLENSGYRVMVIGRGIVKKQSLSPGEQAPKGTQVTIELS